MIHFSSAQPDNVKQRVIRLFKFSDSFQGIKPLHYLLLKKNHNIDTLVLQFISNVPFSSSHILFPDKRRLNCLISDKNRRYFCYRHIFCTSTLAEGVSSVNKAQNCQILLTIMLCRKESYVFRSREILNKAAQLGRK